MRKLCILLLVLLICHAQAARAVDADSPECLTRLVAERVLKDYPQPPPFDWGEGVMMAGMMKVGQSLHEPRYIDFVKNWADHWQSVGIDKLLAGDQEKHLKGYCGQWGPGYPVMLLYEQTKDLKYLEMARHIGDFILHQATRTQDGGLGHWSGNYQLWVDTLYMHGPLMVHLHQIDARDEYLADAVHQLLVYCRHLQDEKTGLFYHMYDSTRDTKSPEFWARGNGWVAMTFVEVLSELNKNLSIASGRNKTVPDAQARGSSVDSSDKSTVPPRLRGSLISKESRDELKTHFHHLMAGLQATQDKRSGLWHTVLNRPDSYAETSASAMILSAFIQAHRHKLLASLDSNSDERAVIVPGWKGICDCVDAWGWVFDVSGGTAPGNFDSYATKVTGAYTWGTGAFLLAASAMIQK